MTDAQLGSSSLEVLSPRAMANPPAKFPTRRVLGWLPDPGFGRWSEARL
jgi:hypothetical protein